MSPQIRDEEKIISLIEYQPSTPWPQPTDEEYARYRDAYYHGLFVGKLLIQNIQQQAVIEQLTDANRELHLSAASARNEAATDELTQLANLRHLNDYYTSHVYQANRRLHDNEQAFSLIALDVDKFKAINDTYGHAEGDTVLQIVGGVLQTHTKREHDVVARIGGDEFVMLLSQTTLDEAIKMADVIKQDIADTVRANTTSNIAVRASVGVAKVDRQLTLKENYAAADKAMYEDKQQDTTETSQ